MKTIKPTKPQALEGEGPASGSTQSDIGLSELKYKATVEMASEGEYNVSQFEGSEQPAETGGRGQESSAEVETKKNLFNDSKFAILSKDWRFETWALCVIVLNASWIGVDVDYNPANNDDSTVPADVFTGVENFFCVCFTSEIIVRVLAYRKLGYFFTDPVLKYWNLFDLTLVLMMVVETWVLAAAKVEIELGSLSILRLLRLLRISRVFRMVPELGMMVKSMAAAIRSVSSTFVLIIGIMYVFGIIFTQWSQNLPEDSSGEKIVEGIDMHEYFGTIPFSFLTLMQILVFDDTFDLIRACMKKEVLMGWLCIIYIIIGAFTILNMLIGVLCEVVANTTSEEKEKIMRAKVNEAFSAMDEDGSGTISRKEFELLGLRMLEKIGISRDLLENAFDIIDINRSGDIDHTEFVNLVFKLLKPPDSRDLLLVQKKLDLLQTKIDSRFEVVLETKFQNLAHVLTNGEKGRSHKPGRPLPAIGPPGQKGVADTAVDAADTEKKSVQGGLLVPGQTPHSTSSSEA